MGNIVFGQKMWHGLRPLKERHVLVNVTITCEYMYCSAHFACKDTCTGSLVFNKLKSVKWKHLYMTTAVFHCRKTSEGHRELGSTGWSQPTLQNGWHMWVHKSWKVSPAVNVVSVHTGMSLATVGNCMDEDTHWILKQSDKHTGTAVLWILSQDLKMLNSAAK